MSDIKRNKDSLVECQKAILENLNKPGDLLQIHTYEISLFLELIYF